MSRRCLLFDYVGSVLAAHQKEHRQIYPVVRRVEHDSEEIWACMPEVVEGR